jgi:hypothetical protein
MLSSGVPSWIVILIAFGFFALGYILGKMEGLIRHCVATGAVQAPRGFFDSERPTTTHPLPRNRIDIDESKVVVGTDTSNMQRNPETELGKTTTSVDDINGSVSRLSKLKKN